VSKSAAHPGWGIVVDKKGNIFFGDVNRNIVWKIDSHSIVSKFVLAKHSHILKLDDAGMLYGQHIEYVSRNDTWLYQYWKASPGGGVENMSDLEAHQIFDLRDRDGNTYVLDSDAHKRVARIFKVTSRGDTMLFAGGKWGDEDGRGRSAEFRTIGSAIWGLDGSLIVASGGMVRKVFSDGTVTTLAGKKEGLGDPYGPNASGILGLAIDSSGNIFAASWEKHKVIKITPGGNVITILESGTFWMPTGVTVVGKDVYVLEHRAGVTGLLEKTGLGGPRVRKISANGTIRLIGTAP
jgi:hypothetical protein